MKTALSTLALACQLALAAPWAAQAARDADAVPQAPIAAPAARVPHAAQAAMLASVRAGSRIVAVGDHGVVLLSDDGGKTHRQAQQVPVDVTLTSVSFVDERRGWAVGHWGVVLNTVDGGETWRVQRSDTHEDRPLFAVHFFDASQGVAVGLWSLVLVTSDGGAHWQAVEMPAPEGARRADLNLLGLFADARGRLFAPAERGMVLRSDDRGQHWRYLGTGYTGSFWTGIAAPDGALLVAGLRGSMYRSGDDGQTWQRIDTHSKSSITALALAGAGIVGVGLDGLMLRSRDGGVSFETEIRTDRLPLTAVTLDGEGHPVMYSRQGIVKAEGAGASGR
ncbi:MAG: glycosyl hydrolase [Burkholderiales bacterium]|nr:glycosyl hydrolase [Burkholderiales bacterium]OJX04379.1 MAG: glycosyl hydrolase [Burkholderiales bacterium 70-64]